MPEKVNFFDEIDRNKRNSLILVAVMIAIYSGLIFVLSYYFELGLCAPIIGIGVLFIYTTVVWFAGDSMILGATGAREIRNNEYPFVRNVVEGLAIASQIPVPKIYLINDPAPNAFATGRDPKHASVAVTTGLLDIMKKEELEGVLAHEISHVANYDIRFSMLAIAFAGAIALLSEVILRSIFYSGGRSNSNRNERGGRNGSAGAGIILALVFAILAPIFAQVVRLALSRERESLADANGAKLTRYPPGLANALEKIKQASIPTTTATETTAPLYFSDPFPQKFLSLFATHPPIEERIKRLRAM